MTVNIDKLGELTMSRGCFIVFEGIDGSGKTAQCEILSEKLKDEYKVLKTKEPTGSLPIGKLIRKVLLKKEESKDISEESLALLFAADRISHLKKIVIPALKNGSVVISDRYVYSSYAYQSKGMSKEMPLDWIYTINKYAIDPDIVIFLDISPELGQERLFKGQKRVQDHTYFETLIQQQKIRSVYYEVLNFDKKTVDLLNFNKKKKKKERIEINKMKNTTILRIDGALSKKKIQNTIFKYVSNYLKEKNVPKNDNKDPKGQSLTLFS